ncbi:MAG: CPBP family intramembrane metalloprotease [Deferribacteraceae bacterium]|nr:CPBP family intramembrane metalloprotease [Deferribacteraceae bacterium]
MKRNLFIFIVMTLASGWIGVLVDSAIPEQTQGNSLGMGLWLILPLLTGIILRIISRDGKDTGIKPNFKGNLVFYIVSIAVYPLVTVATIGLAAIFGSVDISVATMDIFFATAAISVAGNLAKNLFEEFSWRGYLTPKLIALKTNDWLIYIVSGLIWALWHAAYYMVFLPDSYFESTSRASMLLTGCLLMVCWSVMYVEIFRLTKSVWPCVLMHAVEDAFPTVLTTGGFVIFSKTGDLWFNPISGIIATASFLLLGLFLRMVRIKRAGTLTLLIYNNY